MQGGIVVGEDRIEVGAEARVAATREEVEVASEILGQVVAIGLRPGMHAVRQVDVLERRARGRRGAHPDLAEVAALQQTVGGGQAGDRLRIADAGHRDRHVEDVVVVHHLGGQGQPAAVPALRDGGAEQEALIGVIAGIADAVVAAVEAADRDRGVLGDRLGHEGVDARGGEARRGKLEGAARLVEIGLAGDEVDGGAGAVDGQDAGRARAHRLQPVDIDFLLQDRVGQRVDVEDGQAVLLQLYELLPAAGEASYREVVRHLAARSFDKDAGNQFQRLCGRSRCLAVQILARGDGDRGGGGQHRLAAGARAGDDDRVQLVVRLLRRGLAGLVDGVGLRGAGGGGGVGLLRAGGGGPGGGEDGGASVERGDGKAGRPGDAAERLRYGVAAAHRGDAAAARRFLGREHLDARLPRKGDDAAGGGLRGDVETPGLRRGGGRAGDDDGHQRCGGEGGTKRHVKILPSGLATHLRASREGRWTAGRFPSGPDRINSDQFPRSSRIASPSRSTRASVIAAAERAKPSTSSVRNQPTMRRSASPASTDNCWRL